MEIWKTIENYEKYQVSNYGRIRSKTTKNIQRMQHVKTKEVIETTVEHKGRILKGVLRRGYYYITLYNKYNRPNGKTFKISRLVAEYFIPNPENKLLVHHKNGNKLNNNSYNLEWVTDKEHAKKHDDMYRCADKHKCNWKKVRLIDKNLIFDNSIRAAEYLDENYFYNSRNLKLVARNIRRVCLGLRKSTYNFRWEYYKECSETSP